MHGPNEGVSEETDEANSAVKIVGGNVFVELDPDHPGFQDEGYRSRRNEIAKIDVIEIRWWKPNNVNSDVISLIDSGL